MLNMLVAVRLHENHQFACVRSKPNCSWQLALRSSIGHIKPDISVISCYLRITSPGKGVLGRWGVPANRCVLRRVYIGEKNRQQQQHHGSYTWLIHRTARKHAHYVYQLTAHWPWRHWSLVCIGLRSPVWCRMRDSSPISTQRNEHNDRKARINKHR